MSVSVRVSRAAVDPGGPAPTFTVRTNRALCEVQIATDPILFTGAVATRRSPENFVSLRPPVRGQRAIATPDAQSWSRLSRFPHLPYRAIAHDGTFDAPLHSEATVGDQSYASAPAVYVAQAGRAPVRLATRLSAQLAWLRVRGNRIEDEAGDPVVLRGIVRDGMATTERFGIDPAGVRRTTTREVAGITQAEIGEIVGRWGANVIRVPINQEWALTRPDYVAGLDRIIGWAAAEGAHTLLALERLDMRRLWGTAAGIAPLPEENTVRMWTMLANRYRNEAAVLYELYAFPHRSEADDTDFVFERPADDAGWIAAWHGWVRRLSAAIRREHGRALLFVSGWNLGRELASFPVTLGGQTVTALYAVNVDVGTFSDLPADVDRMLAAPALPSTAPVFVSRWDGRATIIGWGDSLEGELRARHRFTDGRWPGLAGWTAGSWGADLPLVEREFDFRLEGEQLLSWEPFVMDGTEHRPTQFGELVRGALRTAPSAASSDFDVGRPFGQRSRFRVTASDARVGDLFVLHGHDLTNGTTAEFTPGGGGAAVAVAGRAIGGFMLLVDELPAAVPLGPAAVAARRPDGVRSDPVALTVLAGPPVAERTIMPGTSKPSPFTIVLLANPWVESETGANVLADPIHTQRATFNQSVGTVVETLFGVPERLLRDYAHEIRVVTRFATAPNAIANALCHQLAAPYMETVPNRVRDFLAALPLAADICFVLFGSGTRTDETAYGTVDDPGSDARAFDLDGRAGVHRRRASRPGAIAQAAPPSDAIVAMHEFLHAVGEESQGRVADLYIDVLPGPETVNRKARPRAGAAVPRAFKTLDGTGYASALVRDGPRLPYPRGALTFHPERIVPAEPNIMDNYFAASAGDLRAVRLDKLTLRFLRDRLEWKLGR